MRWSRLKDRVTWTGVDVLVEIAVIIGDMIVVVVVVVVVVIDRDDRWNVTNIRVAGEDLNEMAKLNFA